MAIGTLTIDLIANVARMQGDLGKAQQQLSRFQGNANKILAGIGAGLTFGGIVSFVRNTANAADELAKLSVRTGITVEDLSVLRYAGSLADVSMEELAMGVRYLAQQMERGNDVFAEQGIAVRDAAGNMRNANDVLGDVADIFARMPDGLEKTALAMELFGSRAGPQLITMLNGGRAALKAAGEEAARFGQIVTTEGAKAAEQFNDNLTRMESAVRGAAIQLGNELLPWLASVTNQLIDGAREAGGFWEAVMILGTVNPFRSLQGNIRATAVEIAVLRERMERTPAAFEGTRNEIEGQVKRLEARLRYLKLQASNQALEGVGDVRDPRDLTVENARRQAQIEQTQRALEAARNAAGTKSKKSAAAADPVKQRMEQLRRELDGLRDLSAEQALIEDLAAGRLGKATAAEREALEVLARRVDAVRKDKSASAEAARAQEQHLASAKQQAEAFRQLADPAGEVAREIEALDALMRAAGAGGAPLLTGEIAEQARAMLDLQAIDARYSGPAEEFLRLVDPTRAATQQIERLQRLMQAAATGAVPQLTEQIGRQARAMLELQAVDAKYAGPAEEFLRLVDPARAATQQIERLEALQRAAAAGALPELTDAVGQQARAMIELQRIDLQYSGPAEAFLRSIDPARALYAEIEKIDAAVKGGILDPNAGARAIGKILVQIESASVDQDVERLLDRAYPDRRLYLELEVLNEKHNAGQISDEEFLRIYESINKEIESAGDKGSEVARDLGLTFASAAEEALVSWQGVGNFLKGLEQDLLRIATRKVFTEPLAELGTDFIKDVFGNGSGGSAGGGGMWASIGSWFSELFSFGGGLASGGDATAGEAYWVGEHGREMALFGRSARVVSNEELRGMGGKQTIINAPVTVVAKDAQSFRGSERQISTDLGRRLAISARS